MSELKYRSIDTHQVWVAFGRPSSGPIYRADNRRAMRYKSNIASSRISIDLHEQLVAKGLCIFLQDLEN